MAPRCARERAALAIGMLLAGGPHPAAGEELGRVRLATGAPSDAGIEWRAAERELIERPAPPPAGVLGSGTGRVKLAVDRDGIYRITGAQLTAASGDLADLPLADLRVMSRGRSAAAHEVAIGIHDEDGDGRLDPDDWFEMWGEALVGEERTGLFEQADFSDVNAYFVDALPGARLRMASRDGTPDPGAPAVTEWVATARSERNDVFLANHRTGQFDVDHFYSCPSLLTGGPSDTRIEGVPLPGLVRTSSLRAALRVRLLSRTSDSTANPDHLSEVRIGATLVSQRTADGYAVVDHDVTGLDPILLSDPASVSVRLPGIIAGIERAELDFIEIDYPRAFTAVDDRLDFRIAGPARVRITGLSSADVSVLDVTDPDAPDLLTGCIASPGAVSFGVEGGGRHLAVAAHPAGAPAFVPRAITWAPDTGLRDPANRADLVVVGPAEWVDPPRPALQRYVDWRASQGVRVRLVATSAMFDEMNDGLFSPFAVSRLLEEALSTWAVPPRWCLLLGDANLDHRDRVGGRVLLPGDCSELPDPCGHHETAWTQQVPTYVVDAPEDQTYLGYFASDSILAMVTGADWMPDVALGRLPARTPEQLDAMLDKIVAYEQLAAAPPAWASRYLTIADEVAPGQEIIEQSQDDAATLVPPCYDRARLFYQRDYGATNPATFTADLLATWSDPSSGGAVASYVGHGNTFTWSSDALFTNDGASCRNDVAALTGSGMPEPLVVNADCIAGGFMHLVGPSLLEDLVRAPQGGAIAAFGPTGITDLSFARTIVTSFYDAIYGPRGRGGTLGDALLRVQGPLAASAAAGAPDEILSNVLLGDPSLRLVIPFGPAALGLVASAAPGSVSLTWDAVPGADSYRLYRSSDGPDGPWALMLTTGTTSALDQAVANATLYHYALEPLAGCLPGRWSDVVAARPCDGAIVPAPPSGFQVVSASCNGDVLLAWQASASAGVAYEVRAFASSADLGLPPEQQRVVSGTVLLMRGLVPFRWYDVEVAAVDGCGGRSVAQRVRVRPSCPLVMDAPAFIDDLRLRRQGGDLVMSWGPVTTTIQGSAFTPADYVVFRATEPDFAADASIVDRVVQAQALQAGRVGNGSRLELFAVAAEDASGVTGSVGHDLPQGALGVSRADFDATRYSVSWDPVRFDIRGDETPVASYEVYASPSGPLTRGDVESMSPVAIVAAPPAILDRALGDWHFVVAVDAHGNRSAY
jgi:hypothetical protein